MNKLDLYERLDDRRQLMRIHCLVAAFAGSGGTVSFLFSGNPDASMWGGAIAMSSSFVLIVMSIRQGMDPARQ